MEKEQLIKLSCDNSLKQRFQNVSLVQFWLNLNLEYNNLSNKALKVLLPFAASYLCETGFSELAAMINHFDDLDFTKFAWIQNPFSISINCKWNRNIELGWR